MVFFRPCSFSCIEEEEKMSLTCDQGHVLSKLNPLFVCAFALKCVECGVAPSETSWTCSNLCFFTLCEDCAKQKQEQLRKKNSSHREKDIKKETDDKGETSTVGSLALRKIAEELENIEAIEAVMESEKETLCKQQEKEIKKQDEEQNRKKENFLKTQKVAFEKFVQDQNKEQRSLTDKHRMEIEEFERTSLNNKKRQNELQTNIQKHLNLSATPDSSSDIPECPVCLEDMKPPLKVFTCRNGHLVCSTCRPKVSLCTNCREEYTGRATAVEQIIRKMLKME